MTMQFVFNDFIDGALAKALAQQQAEADDEESIIVV